MCLPPIKPSPKVWFVHSWLKAQLCKSETVLKFKHDCVPFLHLNPPHAAVSIILLCYSFGSTYCEEDLEKDTHLQFACITSIQVGSDITFGAAGVC